MELGPKNLYGDGLLGPNSIIVVYMDPLGELRGLSGKPLVSSGHRPGCKVITYLNLPNPTFL